MLLKLKGFLCKWVFERKLNAKRWKKFVNEILLPSLPEASVLIWDNLREHYEQQELASLREKGHTIWFTPQYSPEGNPIEYAFSKLKAYLKQKQAKGVKALRQAVDEAFATITSNDIASYHFVAWGWVLSWDDAL